MLRIASLWLTGTDSKASATGVVNIPVGSAVSLGANQRLVLMPNNDRKTDKHPQWFLYIADDENNENRNESNADAPR